MNKIKFRAWDICRKHMFPVLSMTFSKDNSGINVTISDPEFISDGCELMQFTLMQFTGLRDRNGKEIWEGDIVTRSAGYEGDILEDPYICCVFWDDGGFSLAKNGTSFIAELNECEINNRQIKVIGNIYENSNLFENKNE